MRHIKSQQRCHLSHANAQCQINSLQIGFSFWKICKCLYLTHTQTDLCVSNSASVLADQRCAKEYV